LGNRVILANTSLDASAVAPEVNNAIWAVDRHVAMGAAGTIEHWLDRIDYSTPHFGMIFLGAFAAVGLVLVAIGVFSVMLYTVSLQFHELGVRIALGAQPGHILRLVLSNGLRLILIGTAAGLLLSAAATRSLSSLVWGISVTDSWTFAAAAVVISIAGLGACLVPARRATQVDPLSAIRSE
jgi:putative ABC transport system permease protein